MRQNTPTNSELREIAIGMTRSVPGPGMNHDYLEEVSRNYLTLQFKCFPLFCDDTRKANALRRKELEETSTKGRYTDSYGWTKKRTMRETWIISDQLKWFMHHIHKDFWSDENKKVRNSFMRGVLRGDDPYELLGKVYSYYGSNVQETSGSPIIV